MDSCAPLIRRRGLPHLMSNSCRTTNRTVLVAPETEIIRFWTLQQHGSSGSAPAPLLATSLLNPCKTTGRTDLAAPESWITQFWNLQQHKLSGSAPTPLLATSLLIPCRTNRPYCSVRSRIMNHSVLEFPATWIIRFCPPPLLLSPVSTPLGLLHPSHLA